MKYLIIILLFFCSCQTTSINCCGSFIPFSGDGKTSMQHSVLLNGNNYARALRINADISYLCNITQIDCVLTPIGNAPIIIDSMPLNFVYNSCVSGLKVYRYRSVGFESDPTGENYDIEYKYKDAQGNIIASYGAQYALSF